MADIASSVSKMNDVEISNDAAHTEALITKIGANINGLINAATPVGSVIPWFGGYFGDGSNGSFSMVLAAGNTIAQVNTYLPSSWRVCDGTAPNDAASPIFDTSSKFLPNLTDSRFLMGSTTAGGVGGSNAIVDHSHSAGSLYGAMSFSTAGYAGDRNRIYMNITAPRPTTWNATHRTAQIFEPTGTGNFDPHDAGLTVLGTGGGLSTSYPTGNIPLYLACYYIMRIK